MVFLEFVGLGVYGWVDDRLRSGVRSSEKRQMQMLVGFDVRLEWPESFDCCCCCFLMFPALLSCEGVRGSFEYKLLPCSWFKFELSQYSAAYIPLTTIFSSSFKQVPEC